MSSHDIEALREEMNNLRSQLSGVSNAVHVVAQELSVPLTKPSTPPVTQSLPSPPTASQWVRKSNQSMVEEAEIVEEVGDDNDLENNDDKIEAALMMEEKGGNAPSSTLRSSIDSTYSNRSFLSALDDTIPPPPPTPPRPQEAPSVEESFSNR